MLRLLRILVVAALLPLISLAPAPAAAQLLLHSGQGLHAAPSGGGGGGGGSSNAFDATQFVVADAFGHDWAVLTNSARTARFKTGVSGTASVGATTAVSGKCRFELQIPASGAGPNGFGLVGATTKTGGGGLYANADAIGTQWNGSVYIGFSGTSGHGLSNTPGTWVGVEVDAPNKNIYFVQGSSGTVSAAFNYASVSTPGTMYPAVELSSGQGANSASTLNVSGTWNTPVQTGYSAAC